MTDNSISVYRDHAEKIANLINQTLDAAVDFRRVLETELNERGAQSGYQWARLRRRAISEVNDIVHPIEDVVLDRVIRLVDRVMALEKPDSDKDFV